MYDFQTKNKKEAMQMNNIITISRQHGSGGREIGNLLAKKLSIPYYDNELIKIAAQESGFDEKHFREYDKAATNSFLYSLVRGMQYNPHHGAAVPSFDDSIYLAQASAIKKIAEHGPCVIIGRGAYHVFSSFPELVKVFIYASHDFRVNRIMEHEGLDLKKAEDSIKKTDRRRQNYYFHHTDVKWGNMQSYNLCIDSSHCGIERAAEVIFEYLKK